METLKGGVGSLCSSLGGEGPRWSVLSVPGEPGWSPAVLSCEAGPGWRRQDLCRVLVGGAGTRQDGLSSQRAASELISRPGAWRVA